MTFAPSATRAADLNAAWTFCHATLPEVSRTFALNIPLLSPRLRDAVCVAYLLCRIADTIEDIESLDEATRGRLFDALAAAVGPDEGVDESILLRDWAGAAADGYRRLAAGSGEVLAAYRSLPDALGGPIGECVREMVAGMRRLTRRGGDGPVRFVNADRAALDDYCHYVAGTVGQMLTRLFATEAPGAALREAGSVELGRRFGLGLQAVNIIKDFDDDAARGVCFVPRELVESTESRWTICAAGRARLIRHALDHLDCAAQYVALIPAAAAGVRQFCVLALVLALGTLREAAGGAARSPKVSRAEVATVVLECPRRVADDAALAAWLAEYRAAVVARLDEFEGGRR
ncbi:MAG: squalene/phytoene synthase family protein [Phycisphaerae bacterium]